MKKIIRNWVTSQIGDLCDLKNGRAFKPTEWSQSGLPIVRIQNLNNPQAPFNRYSGHFDQKHHLSGGELLFAWSGTPGTSFGAHVWKGKEAVLNQHIFRVDFDESILDRRFFRHAINQKLNELIDVAHGGAGLQHVTKGVFESTEIQIPPRQEQTRIADKLDAVLSRVDDVNARLDRVAPLLKRFRQSVLAAATSGRLTSNFTAYPRENLKSLVSEPLRNGKSVPDGDGIPVLRLSAIASSSIDTTKTKNGDWSGINTERFLIRSGDFLIARGNGSKNLVGRGGMVREVSQPIAYPDTMIRIRANEKSITPKFLQIIWESHEIRDQIESIAKTTAGIWKISQSDLDLISVPVPSLEEQTEIVRRVDILFAFADRLEARLKAARTAAQRLTPAVLAKAFRGELVAQDPADEPAAELLKRLAAQRAQDNAGAGRSRRGRPARV